MSTVDGQRRATKKADIAIFELEAEHTLANLRRVVICKPEPKGGRSVTKIRTYEQAEKDLDELEDPAGHGGDAAGPVRHVDQRHGLLLPHKEIDRFERHLRAAGRLAARGREHPAGTVVSVGELRRGEAGMLKTAFRRCHNYIHGNEGMPKDAAFWQFLYLLFAKMHDERVSLRARRPPQFYVASR